MPETIKVREHHYRTMVRWTGDAGSGTSGYTAYRRDHVIDAPAKPAILGSSDPAFRGDASRWNPEELLVAALSACHQLWYLHLCSDAGIIVRGYEDRAEGLMLEDAEGQGTRRIGRELPLHAGKLIRAAGFVFLRKDGSRRR
jgi:organic hydroperoxide reductase OsmC/OhrA